VAHVAQTEGKDFCKKDNGMAGTANEKIGTLKTGTLWIVSNRLPVSVEKKEGELVLRPTAGGLVTCLGSFYQKYSAQWIGWPGLVAPEDQQEVQERLAEELSCHPVFISERLVEKYYEGFANRTIWPLFHSFPAYTKYAIAEWEAYQEANRLFAETLQQKVQPGDIIWVHDYHLMLLPQYLRLQFPHASLGFFLHIPFPSYEIYRLLPWHREILESLLCCDLLGYHTYDYAQAFLGSVRRLLGHDNNIGLIMTGQRAVQADVFPIGIDFEKFASAPQSEATQREITNLHTLSGNFKIIFSVSRLDYTKGIPENLEAFETFMEKYPMWRKKVVYVLVVVPSREKVDTYASLKKNIDELVGRINARYGTLDWMPIRYIYRSLAFPELSALYFIADVALVAPLRDGMNLIAKEYLASKAHATTGVLVLSDMAGAAKELLEAVIVNPNNKEEVAEALHKAFAMPPEEQKRRNGIMCERLRQYDAIHWTERFLERLQGTVELSERMAVRWLDVKAQNDLVANYVRARRRLILLDYDGTLIGFADDPAQAVPDAKLIGILKGLMASNRNEVVVLSGRSKDTLASWLGNLTLTLGAEHGGWLKNKNEQNWQPTIVLEANVWKKQIRTIMQIFVDRIPGAFIEEKTFGLAWHYRKADVESGAYAARDLLDTLSSLTANLPIQVLSGSKVIEVRNVGIGKGIFYSRFLSQQQWDFILALGDDLTDEQMFAALPPSAYSVKVGLNLSQARFNVQSVAEVRELLEKLGKL
jgi:trehalose 6-phosphate synthase/phosphatase